MIVRVATFEHLSAELATSSEDNLRRRFLPALSRQPGYVTGIWCKDAEGNALSITVWESEQALRDGGATANATPLLPGQRPEQIAGPDRVQIYELTAMSGPHGQPQQQPPA